VIAHVKISYLNVLKVQELVALARENAARIKHHLEVTRRRADAGQRTHTDVLRWEVEYGNAEDAVIRAENGLQLARLQLNEVMGVELGRSFELEQVPVTDTLALAQAAATEPPADTTALPAESILERHPSMGVMRANLDLADAQVSGAWINFKPRLNLAFQYGWEKNGTAKLDGYRPWAPGAVVQLSDLQRPGGLCIGPQGPGGAGQGGGPGDLVPPGTADAGLRRIAGPEIDAQAHRRGRHGPRAGPGGAQFGDPAV
jgi:outer membrane protein TolC